MNCAFGKKKHKFGTDRSVTKYDSSSHLRIERKFNSTPIAFHTQRKFIPSTSFVTINMPRKEKHSRRQQKPQDVMINVDKKIEIKYPGPSTELTEETEEGSKRLSFSLPSGNRIFAPLSLLDKSAKTDQITAKKRRLEAKEEKTFLDKKLNSKRLVEPNQPFEISGESKKKKSELFPILPPGKESLFCLIPRSSISLQQAPKQTNTAESILKEAKKKRSEINPILSPEKEAVLSVVAPSSIFSQTPSQKQTQSVEKNLSLAEERKLSENNKKFTLDFDLILPLPKPSVFDIARQELKGSEVTNLSLQPFIAKSTALPALASQFSEGEMMRIFPKKETYDPAKMTTSDRNKMEKEIKNMNKKRKHPSRSRSSSPSLPPHLRQPLKKPNEASESWVKVDFIEINSPCTSSTKDTQSDSQKNEISPEGARKQGEKSQVETKEELPNNSTLRITFNSPRVLRPIYGKEKIIPFFTNKFVFSNHFPCPGLVINGKKFCCTEQYYMWRKAKFSKNEAAATAILMSNDPKQMKLIGSSLDKFNEREWQKVSWKYMVEANLEKFEQFESLRFQLFRTMGGSLVEASPTDLWWGVGLEIDSKGLRDPRKWKGKNVMGEILMEIREFLSEQEEYREEVRRAKRCLMIDSY